eukprot:13110126-Heterocapsa_arctica.AAC.1
MRRVGCGLGRERLPLQCDVRLRAAALAAQAGQPRQMTREALRLEVRRPVDAQVVAGDLHVGQL